MRRQHGLKHGLAVLCGMALGLALPAVPARGQTTGSWDGAGRVAIENGKLTAAFTRDDGALTVTMKAEAAKGEGMRIAPYSRAGARAEKIVSCKVVKSGGGTSEVEASFAAGREEMKGIFFFNDNGIIKIKPVENLGGISVSAEIGCAVIPGRILDDVIYDPQKFPTQSKLYLPSEQMVMGLMEGGNGILVCAWPKGNQKVAARLSNAPEGARRFEAFDLDLDDQSAFLGILVAPGIWHAVDETPSFLEKDTGIDWKKPFSAVWKTQLVEAATLYAGGVETAYRIQDGRSTTWRAGCGGHPIYPVWFQGDQAFFHLSKVFPPSGRVFIYALEGNKETPVEFANECLGGISSLRTKRTLEYPENLTGIYPCEGHERVTRIFRLGLQAEDQQYLREGMDEWLGRVEVMGRRLTHYGEFIDRSKANLAARETNASPEMRPFLDQMNEHLETFSSTFYRLMEGRSGAEWVTFEHEVIAKLKALAGEEGTECAPEGAVVTEQNHHMFYIYEDRLAPECGSDVREWARQAAYGCAGIPAAVKDAEQIRNDIRDFIGNDNHSESVY